MVVHGSEHNELLLIEKHIPWQYPRGRKKRKGNHRFKNDLKSNIQVRKKWWCIGDEHNELLLIEKHIPWQYPRGRKKRKGTSNNDIFVG